jgi:RNA repair pathway DNA polymerase beta family protein
MEQIVKMRFGSHLYGTDTPESDLDLKGVYLPEARDILLQRVQATITSNRPRAAGEKNVAGDVDSEIYSLQRYLDLLAEGQTVALDMLFAPDALMIIPPSSLWRDIQANGHRLVSRRATAFVHYCRQQANKYGIKGSRVAAARKTLALLITAQERLGNAAKLELIAAPLAELAATTEHVALVDLPISGDRPLRHVAVCDRKISFRASLKTAREIAQRLVDEYGQRALQAERNEGVDWKALSHAVRVGREALELLQSGRITFPLLYAEHILAIKRGIVRYETVATEIEQLLEEVEAAAAASSLPDAPNRSLIEDLVTRAYAGKVRDSV